MAKENDLYKYPNINIDFNNTENAINGYSQLTSKVASCVSNLNTSCFTDELSSYYYSLGDDTKAQIAILSSKISNLASTLSSALSSYMDVDDENYSKLLELVNELNDISSNISSSLDDVLTDEQKEEVEQIKNEMIEKLGYDPDSPEAEELREDIDNFILDYREWDYGGDEEWRISDNISKLKNFIAKIPDNYKDYSNCRWDSEPNCTVSYEGCESSCEWFEINGVKVRITSCIDTTVSWGSLQTLFNRVYCYNIVNEMKTWDPNYLAILAKRDYIDVIVPDGCASSGAAHYAGSSPYSDNILLPTRMANKFLYSDDDTYNYLFNGLLHETSHYLDAIIGVSQTMEFDPHSVSEEDKEFYNYLVNLMNKYLRDCEIINGVDDIKDKYVIGEDNQTFPECLAEFLRADLVDHDAFVDLIGQDNYDKIFNKFKTMNRRSEDGYEYHTRVTGDNNHVEIIRTKDGVEETVEQTAGLYDKTGRLIEERKGDSIIAYEYDDNDRITKKIFKDKDGNVVKSSEYEYQEYQDEKGRTVSKIVEKSSDGMIYEKTFIDKQYTSYIERNTQTGESLEIEFDNGSETKRIYRNAAGNPTREEISNADGTKTVTVYEYDEHGKLLRATTTHSDGTTSVETYG